MIKNDAIILGLLMFILGFIFKTSSSRRTFFVKFYKVIPPILLCYFIPSLLSTFNIIDDSTSKLYYFASRYLLPACLVLLTLSIDFKELIKLGPKAIIMFITGSIGVILGGPLAILISSLFFPDILTGEGPDAVWRGLSTIAGSWIGGGANQAAMYEIFRPSDQLYSIMITVDVIVAEIWMALLLIGSGRSDKIDRWFGAESKTLSDLKIKMERFTNSITRVPSMPDFMILLGLAFGFTAIAHALANRLAPYFQENLPVLERFSLTSEFFWLIILATSFGLLLSFTRFRAYEGAGASKIGGVFIYFLVATIGLKMNVLKVFDNPGLFLVGLLWMSFHIFLLIIIGRLIKAPFFFLAVGSQANIGGAASAPVMAAAFHPSLAPVGVLMAVLGYAIGTYGGWLSGILMQFISGVLGF